jgi:hypothetical protein
MKFTKAQLCKIITDSGVSLQKKSPTKKTSKNVKKTPSKSTPTPKKTPPKPKKSIKKKLPSPEKPKKSVEKKSPVKKDPNDLSKMLVVDLKVLLKKIDPDAKLSSGGKAKTKAELIDEINKKKNIKVSSKPKPIKKETGLRYADVYGLSFKELKDLLKELDPNAKLSENGRPKVKMQLIEDIEEIRKKGEPLPKKKESIKKKSPPKKKESPKKDSHYYLLYHYSISDNFDEEEDIEEAKIFDVISKKIYEKNEDLIEMEIANQTEYDNEDYEFNIELPIILGEKYDKNKYKGIEIVTPDMWINKFPYK